MTKIITGLLSTTVMMLSPFVAGALLTDGRWVNPCAGRTSVMSHDPPPSPSLRPISTTDLLSLKEKIQEAARLCSRTSSAIIQRLAPSVVRELVHYSLSKCGFPQSNMSFSVGTTIEDMLQSEVERLSKIGVFLEQARVERPVYVNQTIHLENKCIEILCQIHVLLNARNQEVTSVVSRDIMCIEGRQLPSDAAIDHKNYLMIRDAKKIFDAIINELDTYMTEHGV